MSKNSITYQIRGVANIVSSDSSAQKLAMGVSRDDVCSVYDMSCLTPQGIVGRCVWCFCVCQTPLAGQPNTAMKSFRLEWGFVILALSEPQIANMCGRVPISLTGELLSCLQCKSSI